MRYLPIPPLSLLFLPIFLAHITFAAVEPDKNWSIIETKHFYVIFDAKNHPLAQIYAEHAESTMSLLKSYFEEFPEKTVLVIDDSTDFANGYATRIPRPTIFVFPALPRASQSIGWYGIWSRELVLHELVHILSFEPANSFYTPLRYLFGNLVAPLMITPRWWLEGIAVEYETRLSDFGRLRSPLVDSQLRAFAKANAFEQFDIPLINESLSPSWPVGQRPYVFGALVWNELIRKTDEKVANTLTQNYSRRLPFLLQNPVIEASGKNYDELLEEALQRVQNRYHEQLKKIREIPPSTAKTILFELEESRVQSSPAISPDGRRLAFIDSPISEKDRVLILERGPGVPHFQEAKVIHKIEVSGASRVVWSESGEKVFFNEAKKRGYYGSGQDLFSFDLKARKKKRLTNQMRVRDFAIGKQDQVAFVATDAGRTTLYTLRQGTLSKHISSEFEQRYSSPVWKDEQKLLFISRGPNQGGGLEEYDLETKERRSRLAPSNDLAFLRKTGEEVVVTANTSGIPNIYKVQEPIDESEPFQLLPLTNAETGFFQGNFHRPTNTLVGVEFGKEGQKLVQIDSAADLAAGKLPQVPLLNNTPWPKFSQGRAPAQMAEARPYRAGPFMWPTYWLPFITPYDDGAVLQATVVGEDPLQRHRYTVGANYDTFSKTTDISTSYSNATSSTPWSVSASDNSTLLRAFNFIRKETTASASFSFLKKNASRDWNYSLGATHITSNSPQGSRYGPTMLLSYGNQFTKGRMISPETGKSLSLRARLFQSGTELLKYNEFQGAGTLATSSWLPKRHALALSGRFFYVKETLPLTLGASTTSAPFDLLGSGFLMRGYFSGQFIGKEMLGTSVEYRFPLFSDMDYGIGTWPLFLRRLHGRVVVDTLTLNGYASTVNSFELPKLFKKFYSGGGLEVYLDSNAAYSYPLSFFLGVYWPFNNDVAKGSRFVVNVIL